ncbi:GH23792 [Drosophila grimshawi]|uniref:GH23792 n=1 Tax=Drosophila grimshawi TaxID=7222 RepID=B4K0T0_DROGR|nr:GH23792 [Drosophila grimshawi]
MSRAAPVGIARTNPPSAASGAAAAAAAAAAEGSFSRSRLLLQLPLLLARKAPWSYPGIDLMATGAFWQNYSESLAQELEMERKTRAANAERDVKSPLSERPTAYYKNSVLFGSAN